MTHHLLHQSQTEADQVNTHDVIFVVVENLGNVTISPTCSLVLLEVTNQFDE